MGSFVGHFVAGFFLILFGTLSLERLLRELAVGKPYPQVNDQGVWTVKLNHFIHLGLGFNISIILATIVGFFVECPGIFSFSPGSPFERAIPHIFLYASHAFWACSTILTDLSLIPEESNMYVFVVSYLFIGQIWWHHSLMQVGSEAEFHQLAAKLCYMVAICAMLAIIDPRKRLAYTYILMTGVVMHGSWMWCIAFVLFDPHNDLRSTKHNDVAMWTVLLYFIAIYAVILTVSAAYYILCTILSSYGVGRSYAKNNTTITSKHQQNCEGDLEMVEEMSLLSEPRIIDA
jgi:hypothetical protein